jgi:hypothetical protein
VLRGGSEIGGGGRRVGSSGEVEVKRVAQEELNGSEEEVVGDSFNFD